MAKLLGAVMIPRLAIRPCPGNPKRVEEVEASNGRSRGRGRGGEKRGEGGLKGGVRVIHQIYNHTGNPPQDTSLDVLSLNFGFHF